MSLMGTKHKKRSAPQLEIMLHLRRVFLRNNCKRVEELLSGHFLNKLKYVLLFERLLSGWSLRRKLHARIAQLF